MRSIIMSLGLAVAVSVPLAAQASRPGQIDPLPRDLEIELALSALPAHLRDSATVYVLDPAQGFVVARQGSNGFSALVARTGDDSFRGPWPLKQYRDDILYPIGFDAAGAKAQMRVFLDAARMQAGGTSARELKTLIQRRFRAGYYRAPERAGLAYMLSPILRTYLNPDQGEDVATTDVPHVMHFAPNVSPADVGAAIPTADQFRYFSQHGRWPETPDPMLILQGPHGYVVQFVGAAERDRITRQYAGMLARLCKIKDAWCLPK